MSNAALSQANRLQSTALPGTGLFIAVGLAVWFTLVLLLGAGEVFVTSGGIPPLALLIAISAPVMLFVVGLWVSPTFRDFVLACDLRFMTGMQAWRIGGLSFLALYTYGVLPGYFAWPAGLGDMAIGVTAPWILVALMRQPSFAASKTFVTWNVLGILDLVAAVGIGALGPRFLAVDAIGASATTQMAHLPLVLVPAFAVPAFIMMHLTALLQARRLAG
jgi:hypothetical protein